MVLLETLLHQIELIESIQKPRTMLKFVTMQDDKVCPICHPLHNSIYPASRFPKSYHPPLHYNCRCKTMAFVSTIKDAEIKATRPGRRIQTTQPPLRKTPTEFPPLIVKMPLLKIVKVRPTKRQVIGR